jgi:antitoxin component YwqK of YwqJK toxin-antitoxin module
MRVQRPLRSSISFVACASLALVALAACSEGPAAQTAVGVSRAAALEPFLEVQVDERWRELASFNPRDEGPYVEGTSGLPDGQHTLWHPNGVKKGQGRFEHGQKQGPWTWWHESGQKRWEGSYRDDRPEGLERSWFENGELEYEGTFEADQREGEWRRFYDNGRPAVQGRYVGGLREGEFRYWSYDGALDRERSGVYEHDVKVAELAD